MVKPPLIETQTVHHPGLERLGSAEGRRHAGASPATEPEDLAGDSWGF